MHAAIRENHRDSIEYLYRRMATNGIDQHERDRVRDLAGIPNRDSNRNVPNSRQGLQPFPLRMLQHVNDLRAWQQWPGKLFSDVPQHVHHGCGCNENAACLRGWTAADIIMFRAGAFNDIGRQVGILTIDYGSVRIHTPVGGMPAARAQIQVPLYAAMHSVLVALSGSSGPGIRANSPLKTPRSFTIQLAGPNFARPLPYPRVFNPTMPPFIPLLARSFPARALLPTRSSRDPNPRPERSAALQELTEAQIQSEAEAESAENNA
ncbi:hypothetical protein MMC21_000676 [Puttea exsequens]|nr:hypothetical protein [Puttea exsequens]